MRLRKTPLAMIGVAAVVAASVMYWFRPAQVKHGLNNAPAVSKLDGVPEAKDMPHAVANATERPGEAMASHPPKTDWGTLFASSNDYFPFVKGAEDAALHGDGAAALYISRALQICQLEVFLYGGKPDPKAAFREWLSAQAHMPEFAATIQERNFSLCKGFFKASAFAGLPPLSHGSYLSASLWRDLAYKDGNPVAEVMHTAMQFPGLGVPSGPQGQRMIAEAQKTFVGALASGDPEAVFRVGAFLVDGARAPDEVRAFAIALTACNLGFDCSADNRLIFGDCVAAMEARQTGESYADVVTKVVGLSGYSEAYAMAQELTEAITDGDVATIRRFVQLKN